MPRLPRILAQGQTPVAQYPRAPYTGDNSAAAILQSTQAVSQTLLKFAELERDKQQLAIKQEISLLGAEIEREVAQQDSDLRLVERDPAAYRERHDKMVDDVVSRTRQRAKNSDTAAALDAKMAGYVGRQKAEAYKHANVLYKERGISQLDETLDARKNLSGLAPDDTVFSQQRREAMEAIDNAVPLIGEQKAGELRRKWVEDTLGARALAESNLAPGKFLENADSRYSELEPKKRQELKERARNQVESDRKSYNAEWEKYYDRMDKEAEQERQAQLTTLRADALSGSLSVSRLDDMRRMRVIQTAAEYDALFKAATEVKEGVSDGATLDSVQMRSRQPVPRITQEEIDAYYRAGRLSRLDWLAEKDAIRQRGEHWQSQGDTNRLREADQGKAVLRAGLDLSLPEDKWTREDGQLWAKALDEYTGRVFQGTEKPLDVAREIGERYAPIRMQQIKLKAEQYKQTLPPTLRTQTPDEAMKMADELRKSGGINQGTYDAYRRTILDWKRIETYVPGKNEPGAASGSGAGKPLREPGQKPESGKE